MSWMRPGRAQTRRAAPLGAGVTHVRMACALLLCASALTPAPAAAQIYTCVAEDGTRVFSDERCGPDAKVVPGISTKRPNRNAASAPRTRPAPKPPAELETLSKACDAGDMKACKEWTLGGGPSLLQRKEERAELECEAGSLSACEERYCDEGLSEDCRASVLRTAKVAGETWYLRGEERGRQDGLVRYAIRCVPQGAPEPLDVAILCSAIPGPDRCSTEDAQRRYARLDRAAAEQCSSFSAAAGPGRTDR